MTNNLSPSECAAGLARLWPKLPEAMRPHASKLAQQIKNFHANPEGLRPMIRKTLAALDAEEL